MGMNTKRRLSMEHLEPRLVLDGVGLHAVIVCLNDNVDGPEAVAKGIVNAHGGELGHVYEYAVKGFSAKLPAAAIEALLKNPHVKRIEPDITMQALVQDLPTGVDRIDGELNQVAKIDGRDERVDVDIAILDTGIDVDHPDLNVVGGVNTIRATSSYNDVYGHGTHVAGIAAALDNGIGVVGVAPGARLWAVKVLNDRGSGSLSDIIKGIDWVTANAATIEVANMSLGGQGLSTTYREAIQRSVAAGVVYVVAAGNSWGDIYGSDGLFGTSDDFIPAAYPEVATISAFADSDGISGGIGPNTSWGLDGQDDAWWRPSNFSNSDMAAGGGTVAQYVTSPGLGIDLVMPGVDINSTYPGGGYRLMSGTSMAAPHAAGLAALYIAANGRATNADGVYAIRQALINGGKEWADPLFGISTATGYYIDGSPDGHKENLGWAGQEADPTPPVAPIGLLVTAPNIGGVLELDWQDNMEPDLYGYNVYRSETSGGLYTRIASSVTGSAYTDTGLTNSVMYYYVVTAVDTSLNESVYSNEAWGIPTGNIPTMHVGDLDATSTNQAKTWTAIVTITVHDNLGTPVAGATVVGSWSGGVTGTVSGTTDINGMCTVKKAKIAKTTAGVTFTVTGVTGSLPYDAIVNHDPDGDSTGTSIDVIKSLHLANESVSDALVGELLTPGMVRPVVDAAVAHWAAAGVAPDRLDTLRGVDVEIFDLDGSLLGLAYSNWVVLDRDAAGYGWTADADATGSFHSGAVDLLSAVTHEFGHLLGFEHSDGDYDVMAGTLLAGTRLLPDITATVTYDSVGVVLDSPWLLPVSRRDVVDYAWLDHATGLSDLQDSATMDVLLLPVSAADYVDRPRNVSKARDFRVLRDIADDETELLDDDLLALLAASRS
jgi:subtilisin